MWVKPWTMKEGFLIGGGLIITGLLLETCVGPIVWEYVEWPANIILSGVFIFFLGCSLFLEKRWYFFRFIGTNNAAVPTLVYVVCLTIIMGLTRQQVNGSWFNGMLSFWPFVLIYILMDYILGIVIAKQVKRLFNSFRKGHVTRKISTLIFSLLFHAGLFISLTCATLGNVDMQRVKMITGINEPEWRVIDGEGNIREMDIAIELKKFIMETYEDGSPRRFASEIQIYTKSGQNILTTVDVNKPFEIDGWKIYQYGFDTTMGKMSNISILELVRDPWLPVVFTGIYLMIAGAVGMFLFGAPRREALVTQKD